MLQEVTLRKSGSAEKLGLTVCYSSGSGSEDADTEVYISEIVPESLAARDGRLREGDQILRVKIRNFPLHLADTKMLLQQWLCNDSLKDHS